MLDCAASADLFHCPTKWELYEQLKANMPPGRAWQNPDAPGERYFFDPSAEAEVFETGLSGAGTEPEVENLTIMEQCLAAIAEVLEWLHERICQLIEEMFCDTTNELALEWAQEFGFPDACEPYANLCAKVYAKGGASLEFLRSLAVRVNAAIVVDDKSTDAAIDPNTVRIQVPGLETAPPPVPLIPFHAGAIVAGHRSPCFSSEDALAICMIERVRHAHLLIDYEVI